MSAIISFKEQEPTLPMHQAILLEIVILLAMSVISVAMFRRWHLPPVLAYLVVGILVGPHNWGWVSDSEDTRFLAEFGVVFLMFTVGLEFSFPQLVAMRKEVFGIGAAQVGLTTLIVLIFLVTIGESISAAFIVGGVIALSSTAIVIKQLNEQLEINSRHGRLSIAILIFQDLAVIPFLIIIPALNVDADSNVSLELFYAVIKGILVIGFMLALGRWLLRPMFQQIAKLHSSELFTLTILLFSVAAAWVTDFAPMHEPGGGGEGAGAPDSDCGHHGVHLRAGLGQAIRSQRAQTSAHNRPTRERHHHAPLRAVHRALDALRLEGAGGDPDGRHDASRHGLRRRHNV